MTYLQDVMYSNDLVGTSSSGASLITYAKRWQSQGHENANILLGVPKLYEPIDPTEQFAAYFRLRSNAISSFYADMTTWWNTSLILQQEESTVADIETTEPYNLVDTTTSWDAPLVFQWERFTTTDTELKDFIQYWQRRKILDRFDVLAQREDNWDGYDSRRPTELTLGHAKHLMIELLDSIIFAGHSWIKPFISSDEDGYITAEWHKGERELHIQIEENEVEYIKVWGTNIDTEMHVDFLSRDNYLTLWEWLLDG